MPAPWFVSEVSEAETTLSMNDDRYERIPCNNLILVAIVERKHLLHSLTVAVQFSKSSIVSLAVLPGDLIICVDVCR